MNRREILAILGASIDFYPTLVLGDQHVFAQALQHAVSKQLLAPMLPVYRLTVAVMPFTGIAPISPFGGRRKDFYDQAGVFLEIGLSIGWIAGGQDVRVVEGVPCSHAHFHV